MNDMPQRPPLFASRWAILRAGIDPAAQAGLEVGPLASPVFAKSEGAITYVDYADAAALRATYRNDPGVDAPGIVEIDAIWGEAPLHEAVGGARFDYVLASHVAEHVPDLITWLAEVRAVLRPQGELRLVLPDHRFSFDVLRGPTRLTDLLTNWLLRARRPPMHSVLDFRLHYAPAVDGQGIYEGRCDVANLRPEHSFEVAVATARSALADPSVYLDVHCWVFQPRQFAELMARLADLGLLGFACAGLTDTAPPLFEFYVFLRPCDDPAEAAASWRAIVPRLRDPLPGSMAEREAAAADAAQRARARAAAERAEAREAELAAARAEIAILRGSTSWRVTAPLRWLGRRLGSK